MNNAENPTHAQILYNVGITTGLLLIVIITLYQTSIIVEPTISTLSTKERLTFELALQLIALSITIFIAESHINRTFPKDILNKIKEYRIVKFIQRNIGLIILNIALWTSILI